MRKSISISKELEQQVKKLSVEQGDRSFSSLAREAFKLLLRSRENECKNTQERVQDSRRESQ